MRIYCAVEFCFKRHLLLYQANVFVRLVCVQCQAAQMEAQQIHINWNTTYFTSEKKFLQILHLL